MGTIMKDCPSCSKQILAEASFCPFCGARFEVIYQGYCNTCHAIKTADHFSKCETCGSEVIDRQPQSRYLGESASLAVAQEEKPQPTKKKTKRTSCAGCLSLIIGLLLIMMGLLYISQDARNFLQGLLPGNLKSSESPPARLEGTQIPTQVAAAGAERSTPTARSTRTPAPTPTLDIRFPSLSSNALCMSTYKYGLSCLEDSGWIQVPQEDFPGNANPIHITSCAGRFIILTSRGLFVYSGGRWSRAGDDFVSYPGWVGCGSGSAFWLVDSDAASYFDGVSWTDHTYSSLFPGTSYLTVMGVAVTASQQLWIATSSAVLHYDGNTWTRFEKDKGFNNTYSFSGIAVDSKGMPWVSHLNGLATYNGKTWTYIPPPASSTVDTVYVDAKDRVWVGTYVGVSVYEKGNWKRYPMNNLAGKVNSVVLDGQERVWAATDWGLALLDKGKWTVYQISNSGLLMNSITHVTVLGKGPELPAMLEKDTGMITGRLLNGGLPLVKARVEVCMQPLGMIFSGPTPCSDQPTRASTTTDAEGRYTISDLPPGYYSVTFQTPDGKWKVVSNSMSIGGVQLLVNPGESTGVDDMDIGTK